MDVGEMKRGRRVKGEKAGWLVAANSSSKKDGSALNDEN